MSEDKHCMCIMQYSEKCKKRNGITNENNFYKSTSGTFSTERVHICKDCIREYVYGDNVVPDVHKFMDILRLLDMPFITEKWNSCYENRKETIGLYFQQMSLNYKGKKWLDGDLGEDKEKIIWDESGSNVTSKGESHKDLRKLWGNFSNEELEFLQDDYREWQENNDITTLSLKKIVRRLCIKELRIKQAEELNESTDKLDKSYIELLDKANLTPKNLEAMKQANKESEEIKRYSQKIQMIETICPAEYYKDKHLWEDKDELIKYIKEIVLRPLKNLLTKERDFSGKYSIEDEVVTEDEDE